MPESNHMSASFPASSENESLSRMLIAAFMSQMDPTLEELSDVKTAVSEAVTNAIIHGYADCKEEETKGEVLLTCDRDGRQLVVTVVDEGVGIEDVELAMQPFYTSGPKPERTGMGFSFMEAFMDRLEVASRPGEGTRVYMWKYIEGGSGD